VAGGVGLKEGEGKGWRGGEIVWKGRGDVRILLAGEKILAFDLKSTSCHDLPVFALGELPSTCSEPGRNDDWKKKRKKINK